MNKYEMVSPAPYMPKTEINCIIDLLYALEPRRVLEWGAGGSTVNFSKFPFIEEWIVIEHNLSWIQKIRENCSDKVKVYQHHHNLAEYVTPPEVDGLFDFVFIDGCQRTECIRRLPSILSSRGFAVVHDTARTFMHSAFAVCDNAKVLTEGELNKNNDWHRGLVMLWNGVDLAERRKKYQRKLSSELSYWTSSYQRNPLFKNDHFERAYTTQVDIPNSFYFGKTVLDIGSGPRGSLEWATNSKTVAVDTLAHDYLKLGIKQQRTTYVAADAKDLPFKDEHFDVVSLFNSLDHVNDARAVIREAVRVTKIHGLLLLLVDIGHQRTSMEPLSLSRNIISYFQGCSVAHLKYYKRHPYGVYQSVDAGIVQVGSEESGVLMAKVVRDE